MIRSIVLGVGVWLCLASSLVAADALKITHGPFVGHTTASSVWVWARVSGVGEPVLLAHDVATSKEYRATATAAADDDFCVVWKLDGLASNRRFSYRIALSSDRELTKPGWSFETFAGDDEPQRVRIVMGSCSKTDKTAEKTWKGIAAVDPDAVILIGDTPYIDSTKIDVLRKKHQAFAAFAPMAAVLQSTAYYSTWDDHDFGKNDTDGQLPGKENSREVFREFRPNPSCGEDGKGIYTKFRAGPVEVFLIDTRFFAACEPSPVDASKPSLLGKKQWEWLRRELTASTASFKFLVNGMVWNAATRPNKLDQWETYDHERLALWRYIGDEKIPGVVLFGGDVHRSRALFHSVRDLAGYDILELTTSPMHGSVIAAADAPHPDLRHDAGVPSSFMVVDVDSRRGAARMVARAMDGTGRELFAVCAESDGTLKSLRPRADLPPLLEFADGRVVKTKSEFSERRREIVRLLEEHFVGTRPREVPKLLSSKILEETKDASGARRQRVRVVLRTPKNNAFEMHVWIPPGEGPFPLILTQPRDYQLPWAEMALARGYAVCLYPGVDSHQSQAKFPGYHSVWNEFRAAYPEATWSEIHTKAWLASRAIDFLLDPVGGYSIDSKKIGIIGFSRYGKQSIIAAAFDERITSVVARSPGSPGSCPYRFTSRNTCAEAPADFPSEWFRPSLRSFTGRENELPIDAHAWAALIAPRRLLIHTAHNDGSEPTFAVERAYLEGRKVYSFLGAPENYRIHYRTGQHGPITDEQRVQNLDWFDLSFRRGEARSHQFGEELLHDFDFAKWKASQPEESILNPFASATAKDDADRRSRVSWVLGARTRKAERHELKFLTAAESSMMSHDRWAVGGVVRVPVSFGDGVRGNAYFDPKVQGPRRAVIWLHPYAYHSGYNEGYGVEGTTVYHRLAQAGYVVLAYDQCGFGLRLLEGRDFYATQPAWSKLGRMVEDVSAAVTFLAEGKGAAKADLPTIDAKAIYLLGFSLGGNVALHAAALDERIAGVASFSGFTPHRLDHDYEPTGGLQRLSKWHALVPKLGLFDADRQLVPYDYEDLLALIAPRPCLLYTPRDDRDADIRDIRQCFAKAAAAYKSKKAAKALRRDEPVDIGRFQKDQHEVFLKWLGGLTK